MEVVNVSKCYIKPSSPTPYHLKTHKIGLLDQIAPPIHYGLALFYPNNHQDTNLTTKPEQRSQVLKQSLSRALTNFYPLAGKIKDNLSIDCNDEGAYYVEARIKCSLPDYLNKMNYNKEDLSLLHKFLPSEYKWLDLTPGSHVLMVQETKFTCGGLAICALFSHKIVDANCLSIFLKAWTAAAALADHDETNQEDMLTNGLSAIFPQDGTIPRELSLRGFFERAEIPPRPSEKRFRFDGSAIARLKDEVAASTSMIVVPTRVEAVSALLCKCIMFISKAKSDVDFRPTVISHSVNLRRRATPPIPESSLGNLIWGTTAICTTKDPTLATLVCLMRESIAKINGVFVKNLQGAGLVKLSEELKETSDSLASYSDSNGKMGFVGFTSWCNFGFYEVDFGWGKPAWMTPVSPNRALIPDMSNVEVKSSNTFAAIALLDSKLGRGVEAVVTAGEEEIIKLEHDQELLAYACVDPNPLTDHA